MLINELGIDMELKPVQLENPRNPILVTESGIDMELKPVQL